MWLLRLSGIFCNLIGSGDIKQICPSNYQTPSVVKRILSTNQMCPSFGKLNSTSQGILHYLWSADLPKSFSRYHISIYFFYRFCSLEKCWVIPCCLYLESLSLTYLRFIVILLLLYCFLVF